MATNRIPCLYDQCSRHNTIDNNSLVISEHGDSRPTRKDRKEPKEGKSSRHHKSRKSDKIKKSKDFQVEELDSYEKYTKFTKRGKCIIEYGAPWCTACMDINPTYIDLCRKWGDKIKMGYVNIDKCNLQFESIPVFVALHHGKEIDHVIGSNHNGLENLVAKLIAL